MQQPNINSLSLMYSQQTRTSQLGLFVCLLFPHKLLNAPFEVAAARTHRYWNTACCLEQDGWSMGMSAMRRCLPSRYALCLWMYMTGRNSSFLKGYRRHRFFGIRASGGSLYLITTPRKVLASSRSAPDSSKFGFSLLTGAFSLGLLSGCLSSGFWSTPPPSLFCRCSRLLSL